MFTFRAKDKQLNTAGFISRRIIKSGGQNRLSKPIVLIATIGVSLGIAVMILSVGIVQGFQTKVRELVIGFGSHIQIVQNDDNFSKESQRVEIDQEFYPSLTEIDGVKHIQQFATKAGILETPEQIQGVVIKGIAEDFDWSFFQPRIVKGEALVLDTEERSTGILISSYMANRLELDTNDRVTVYFIQGDRDISPRNFRVKGIYNTGLEEFDSQYVFVDMSYIQKLSDWGIEAQIVVDSCIDGKVQVKALAFGGDGDFNYEWQGLDGKKVGPRNLCLQGDTTISVVVSDGSETIPDTAWVSFQSTDTESCNCNYTYETRTSGGSAKYYCGGFEVLIDDYEDLFTLDEKLIFEIPFHMKTVNVREQSPEIFSWLEVLDVNVIIIIVLMILVSIINLASALLIIILERTTMIGALKAFGITNRGVVGIFIYHAVYIIGRGLIFGNLLALGLAWLQFKFKIVTLDPKHYYVSEVPINLDWTYIAVLNIGTLIVSILLLIIPALYVTRISPAKAIRFD